MEIIKLNKINEMAECLLNNNINNQKYDYYFKKDISWLLDNEEEIKKDFYSNVDKMKFYIIMNTKFLEDTKINLILKIDSLEEFTQYIHVVPFRFLKKKVQNNIVKLYNKFLNSNDFEKIEFFQRNSNVR